MRSRVCMVLFYADNMRTETASKGPASFRHPLYFPEDEEGMSLEPRLLGFHVDKMSPGQRDADSSRVVQEIRCLQASARDPVCRTAVWRDWAEGFESWCIRRSTVRYPSLVQQAALAIAVAVLTTIVACGVSGEEGAEGKVTGSADSRTVRETKSDLEGLNVFGRMICQGEGWHGERIAFAELYEKAISRKHLRSARGRVDRQWQSDIEWLKRKFAGGGVPEFEKYLVWLRKAYYAVTRLSGSGKEYVSGDSSTFSPSALFASGESRWEVVPPTYYVTNTGDTLGKLLEIWGSRSDASVLVKELCGKRNRGALGRWLVEGICGLGGDAERAALVAMARNPRLQGDLREAILCHIWRMPVGNQRELEQVAFGSNDAILRGLGASVLLRWGVCERKYAKRVTTALRSMLGYWKGDPLDLACDQTLCLIDGLESYLGASGREEAVRMAQEIRRLICSERRGFVLPSNLGVDLRRISEAFGGISLERAHLMRVGLHRLASIDV